MLPIVPSMARRADAGPPRAGAGGPGARVGWPRGPVPAGPEGRQPADGDGVARGNAGSLDRQAFSAAATFGSLGFSPPRKRSAPGDGGVVGLAVGRVAGTVSPCAAMQLRNAWNAAAN